MPFPVQGVQLDLGRSNEREVWLRINKRSGGLYKCQVSVEGTFNSVSAERRLEVLSADWAPLAHQPAAGLGGPNQRQAVQHALKQSMELQTSGQWPRGSSQHQSASPSPPSSCSSRPLDGRLTTTTTVLSTLLLILLLARHHHRQG